MDREVDLLQQIEALRERLSRLSEAGLRINESLDFDTVLQDVLDSARALTRARYGVITLLDESGRVRDFLSSGMTPEEAEGVWGHGSAGLEIFNHLNSFQEPLRLPDLLGHIRSMGLPNLSPPMPVGSAIPFLAAPVFHRGERFGNLFLAERERGEEFTLEDEETLQMFASQAAMVIANARRYRDERRARNDLETLINTSPVGVAVFDVRTGAPLSFNREAMRMMDTLRNPDQPPEHLLEVMTVRRADGREISLEELPMSQALSAGETVRAEEVALQVPDGRSVTVLINATPIRSEDGEIETLVVTMQDMTPLQEIERLRAEFLAMVSHELRTPLATVRGSVSALLDEFSGMHPAEVRQFHRIIFEQTDRMRALIAELLDVARIATGTLSIAPGPTDIAVLAAEAGNAFRIGGHGHSLRIDVPPDLPWVMVDRSRIVQVLGNLLTNAARHSPESSTIRVSAAPGDLQVSVSVSDDGRGIPAESMPHLFQKFSRLESEERGGDTGLGLAVCKGIVEAHGGRIWAESDGPGLGATFTFTLPTVEEAGFVSPAAPPQLSTQTLAQVGAGTGAHPGGGRRPPGAQVRPRRPDQVGLCGGRDQRARRCSAPSGGGKAPSGPPRPDAAGSRRDRPDEGHRCRERRAGHLRVRLRPGPPRRQGLRDGGGRLRRQALLADRARGPYQGGSAQAHVVRAGSSLCRGRPDHQTTPNAW